MSEITEKTVVVGPCKCGGYGVVYNAETEAELGRCHDDLKRFEKHTAEPWRLGKGHCVVADEPVHEMNGSDALEYYGGHLIAESVVERNARRIVACVNACAGIATDALEAVAMQGAPAQKLVEQRDKLLEALNEAADLLVDAGIPATKFLSLIAEVEASK